ncbi:hypothetical protein IQ07DRAFT_634447 [Pyrenochaeta sp. DS3sAY3a]|nr:hypothetical protein IQ07DRAFT_634447 [Pyrenochaeta sp. DS3sAY3a]
MTEKAMAAYIADARKDPTIAKALDDDMFFLHNYPQKDNTKAMYAKLVKLPPQALDKGIRNMFMRTQYLLPPQLRPQAPVPQGTVIKREEDSTASNKASPWLHREGVQRQPTPQVPMSPYGQRPATVPRAPGSMPPPNCIPSRSTPGLGSAQIPNGGRPQGILSPKSSGNRVQKPQSQPKRSLTPVEVYHMTMQARMGAQRQAQPQRSLTPVEAYHMTMQGMGPQRQAQSAPPQAMPQASLMSVPVKPKQSRSKKVTNKD